MSKLHIGLLVAPALLGLGLLGIVMNLFGVITQTTRPENIIGRYEEFFDRCAVIERYEVSLASQKQMLADAEDKAERSRIRANISGLTAQRQGAISQYNADAAKLNVGVFQSNSLPQRLDAAGTTNCGR